MSTQPDGRPPAGAEVNVPVGAIIQALHEKYGRLISTLIQENAELQAGVEGQGRELAYLRSVVAAFQEDGQDAPGPAETAQEPTPGLVAPGPLG
jgi:hypothetical protein